MSEEISRWGEMLACKKFGTNHAGGGRELFSIRRAVSSAQAARGANRLFFRIVGYSTSAWQAHVPDHVSNASAGVMKSLEEF